MLCLLRTRPPEILRIPPPQQATIGQDLPYIGVFKALAPPYLQMLLRLFLGDRSSILQIKIIALTLYQRKLLMIVHQVHPVHLALILAPQMAFNLSMLAEHTI